jgi:hypothetical protein
VCAVSNLADEEAAAAIRAHHVELNESLRARVATLCGAVRSGTDNASARDAVIAYLEDERLPHAAAEESALYPAVDTGITAMLVRAMRDEHRNLVGRVHALLVCSATISRRTSAAWKTGQVTVVLIVRSRRPWCVSGECCQLVP